MDGGAERRTGTCPATGPVEAARPTGREKIRVPAGRAGAATRSVAESTGAPAGALGAAFGRLCAAAASAPAYSTYFSLPWDDLGLQPRSDAMTDRRGDPEERGGAPPERDQREAALGRRVARAESLVGEKLAREARPTRADPTGPTGAADPGPGPAGGPGSAVREAFGRLCARAVADPGDFSLPWGEIWGARPKFKSQAQEDGNVNVNVKVNTGLNETEKIEGKTRTERRPMRTSRLKHREEERASGREQNLERSPKVGAISPPANKDIRRRVKIHPQTVTPPSAVNDDELPGLQSENCRRAPIQRRRNPRIHQVRTAKTRPNELRILQINANGIGSIAKRTEIVKYAEEVGAHIMCIQESNLSNKQVTPIFEGWEEVGRADRKRRRGGEATQPGSRGHGGVLTLMKSDCALTCKPRTYDLKDANSEAVLTEVICGDREFLILNAYIAVVRSGGEDTRTDQFDPANLPTGENLIVAADINGHHGLWDSNSPEDTRGRRVAEWMDLNDFCALNTGNPTRFDFNGRGTAPDITMVHASRASDFDWRVGQDVSSDHRPIVITAPIRSPPLQKTKSKPRPCMRKTDWAKFREKSEITFSKTKFNKSATLNTMVNRFTKAVTAAAKAATPMATPRPNAKAWWNPEVENAVKKRRACQDERNNNLDPAREETLRAAYNTASAEARETIIEAKAATM